MLSRLNDWSALIRRFLPLCLVAAIGVPVAAFASTHQPTVAPLITQRVDDSVRVSMKGTVHPLATSANDRGSVDSATPVRRMMMVLKRSDAQGTRRSPPPSRPCSARFAHLPSLADSRADWLTVRSGPAGHCHGYELAVQARASPSTRSPRRAASLSSPAQPARSPPPSITAMHSYTWKGGTYTANASDPREDPVGTRPTRGRFHLHGTISRSTTPTRIRVWVNSTSLPKSGLWSPTSPRTLRKPQDNLASPNPT